MLSKCSPVGVMLGGVMEVMGALSQCFCRLDWSLGQWEGDGGGDIQSQHS